MSDKIHYLSDEELNSLIGDVESEKLIEAPANLDQKVIAVISSAERRKTVDFYKYCARVGFAVAAAIALICIVPYIPSSKVEMPALADSFASEEIPSREEVLFSKEIKSKEEVLSKENRQSFIESQITNWFE